MNASDHILEFGGKKYCILLGELDKASFREQCAKCSLVERCIKKGALRKNVPGDWHGINATGLYGKEFTDAPDKFKKKDIRNIAKIVGLALCYGGTAYTISVNMKTTVEKAQVKIDAFFRLLVTLKRYMDQTVRKAMETGRTVNLFGRIKDISKLTNSKEGKDRGFARRTALNNPIQSSAAEVMKIAMLRADDFILRENLTPLAGMSIPQKLDIPGVSYRDIRCGMLHSVHDEVLFQVREGIFDIIVPSLYNEMQLRDITDAFQVKFNFELDVEYDPTRSWTASKSYPASKVFLLNKVRTGELGRDLRPNAILIEFNALNKDLLDRINSYVRDNEGNTGSREEVLGLAVETSESIYFHPSKFPVSFIEDLHVVYNLVHIA